MAHAFCGLKMLELRASENVVLRCFECFCISFVVSLVSLKAKIEVIWSHLIPISKGHASQFHSHFPSMDCFFRNISTKKPHISWENQKGFRFRFPLNQSISPRLRQPWQSPRAFRGCQASHPLLFGRPPGAGSFPQTMKRRARPPLFFSVHWMFLIFLLNLGFRYFVFWFLSFDVKHCHSAKWLWDLWLLIPPKLDSVTHRFKAIHMFVYLDDRYPKIHFQHSACQHGRTDPSAAEWKKMVPQNSWWMDSYSPKYENFRGFEWFWSI